MWCTRECGVAGTRSRRTRTPIVYSAYGDSESYNTRRTTTSTPSPQAKVRPAARRTRRTASREESIGTEEETEAQASRQPEAHEWASWDKIVGTVENRRSIESHVTSTTTLAPSTPVITPVADETTTTTTECAPLVVEQTTTTTTPPLTETATSFVAEEPTLTPPEALSSLEAEPLEIEALSSAAEEKEEPSTEQQNRRVLQWDEEPEDATQAPKRTRDVRIPLSSSATAALGWSRRNH